MVRRTMRDRLHHQLGPLKARDTLDAVRATADKGGSVAAPGALFRWPVRVYYEDTDAGGVVYYANYLKFFERCRTEWLRALGVDQVTLAAEQGLQFVVARTEVNFLAPARLDDELAIEARITQLGRCSLEFEQAALRAGQTLAHGRVRVACVDAGRRQPARLPQALLCRLSR
jgi:acyl-CoA thioester hydrolase